LLLLTRLNYQPELFNFDTFNIQDFMTELLDQVRYLAQRKHILINENNARPSLIVQGDVLHLRRLFFNLFDNAIKFSESGSRIDVRLKLLRKHWQVTIKDYGPGMDEDSLQKIFQRFYRIDHHAAGCGLGLNIAQSIARVHNGSIDVDSQPNQGTTFSVTLPKAFH
jgi:signal transduction histidine kinase